MKYPVTVEQIEKEFEESCGKKIPDNQQMFWRDFSDLINSAYDAGVIVGAKKAQEAVSKK